MNRIIGDKSDSDWVAWCASCNGDTCTRYCKTEAEADYWVQVWNRSGGRVALKRRNAR